MDGVLRQVTTQTLHLAMFAKSVGIPFEVYGFTDHGHSSTLQGAVARKFWKSDIRADEVDLTGTVVFELLSSRMSESVYDLALQELRAQAFYGSRRCEVSARVESLGGTPLNETIIIAHDLVKDFKSRNKVQKTIVIFLTDGEGCTMSTGNNCDAYKETFGTKQFQPGNRQLSMKLHGRQVEFATYGPKTYATLMQNLKITQDCITIGYCLIPENAAKYIPDKCTAILAWEKKRQYKLTRQACEVKALKFRTEKFCEVEGGNGYDCFMYVNDAIFRGKDEAEFQASEVGNARSIGEINRLAKQFSNFKSKKAQNRFILNNFVEWIA
jgi:hypothetical protein